MFSYLGEKKIVKQCYLLFETNFFVPLHFYLTKIVYLFDKTEHTDFYIQNNSGNLF